jgi:predicted dehydrogenase
MEKVKIGVVGCGSVSQRVYIPKIASMPEVDFIAVCDVVRQRAEEAACRHHPKEVYDDFEKMLSRADIDTVVNLTPVFSHRPITQASLQAGKHVFTEKPIATSVSEANELIEEARKRRLKLVCAPVFLLNPAIKQSKDIIARGTIGKVCFARGHGSHAGLENIEGWPTDATWFLKTGAGPLFDLGVYPLTVITGLLGPAKRVTAFSGVAVRERHVKGGTTKGAKMKTEAHDNSHLLLDFGESVFASVDGTFCVKAVKGPAYEFYGSNGVLVINRSKGSNFWFEAYIDGDESPVTGWLSSRLNPFESWRITLPTRRHTWEDWTIDKGIEHLVECILQDKPPIPNCEHARHVVEIIEGAYEAARTGKAQQLATTF